MALATLPGTVYRENPQKPQKALPPVSLQRPLPLFHNRKPTQTENSSRQVTLTDGSYDLVFFPTSLPLGSAGTPLIMPVPSGRATGLCFSHPARLCPPYTTAKQTFQFGVPKGLSNCSELLFSVQVPAAVRQLFSPGSLGDN